MSIKTKRLLLYNILSVSTAMLARDKTERSTTPTIDAALSTAAIAIPDTKAFGFDRFRNYCFNAPSTKEDLDLEKRPNGKMSIAVAQEDVEQEALRKQITKTQDVIAKAKSELEKIKSELEIAETDKFYTGLVYLILGACVGACIGACAGTYYGTKKSGR